MSGSAEVGSVVEVLFDGSYKQCTVTRVRLKNRFDVIEKEGGQRYFGLHGSRLKLVLSEKRKPMLHAGDSIKKGTESGIIKKIRRDGRVDVAWKNTSKYEVAVRPEELLPTKTQKKTILGATVMLLDDTTSRTGQIIKLRDHQSVDVAWTDGHTQSSIPSKTLVILNRDEFNHEDSQYIVGSRVLVQYTETKSYPGTVAKVHEAARQVLSSGAAVPGTQLTFSAHTKQERSYDLKYDDNTEEHHVPASRLSLLLHRFDPETSDECLGVSPKELSERWCRRRDAACSTNQMVSCPLLKRGDSIFALDDDNIWKSGFVLQAVKPYDTMIRVAFAHSDKKDVCVFQPQRVRKYDLNENHEKKNAIVQRKKTRIPLSNELRVGAIVLAPVQFEPKADRTKAPARVVRCHLNGTVDLEYIDKRNVQRGVSPEVLLLQSEDPKRGTHQNDDNNSLNVGDQVSIANSKHTARILYTHANGCYSIEDRDGVIRQYPRAYLNLTNNQEAESSSYVPSDSSDAKNNRALTALIEKARTIVAQTGLGVPGGVRSVFLPLTLYNKQSEVADTDLDELFAAKGLQLTSEELEVLTDYVNRRYGKSNSRKDRISLDALCQFASGKENRLAMSHIEHYLNSPAALTLRQELLRCVQRYGGPPDAGACFDELDLNKDGGIDRTEFDALITKIGARLSTQTKSEIFRCLDKENKGYISRQEFIIFVRLGFLSSLPDLKTISAQLRRLGGTRKDQDARLIMDTIDSNHDGKISRQELEGALKNTGWGDEALVDSLINTLDTNGDGVVDPKELTDYIDRNDSSNAEERTVLHKFRIALARWVDSPCALRQLEILSQKGPGTQKQFAADLETLNLGMTPRERSVIAACSASVSIQNLHTFAMDVFRYYDEAIKTLWKPLENAFSIATLLNGLHALTEVEILRLLLPSHGQPITQTIWNQQVVPLLVENGTSRSIAQTVGSLLAPQKNTRLYHWRSLLQLIKTDPISKLQRVQGAAKPRLKKNIEEGDAVQVLTREKTTGRVVRVRPNGRFDIEFRDRTVDSGIRRQDIRLLYQVKETPVPKPRVASTSARCTKTPAVGVAQQQSKFNYGSLNTSAVASSSSSFGGTSSLYKPQGRRCRGVSNEATISGFVIE